MIVLILGQDLELHKSSNTGKGVINKILTLIINKVDCFKVTQFASFAQHVRKHIFIHKICIYVT